MNFPPNDQMAAPGAFIDAFGEGLQRGIPNNVPNGRLNSADVLRERIWSSA
jgi:hypothetical protein